VDASIRKAYQRFANVYDITFGKISHKGRWQSINMLDVNPGENILEVGVGTGLTLSLFPDDCNVTGIDLSEEMLQKAHKIIKDSNRKNIKIMKMDAMNMDFPDNHFDKVIAAYVISVVPDPIKVLKEMSRVCKKGGKIIFINHFKCENKLIGSFESLINPLSKHFGFKADLELDPILKEIPEINVTKVEGANHFNYWKVVEGVNVKGDACL